MSWAVVGGVQKVNSETGREREIGYYCDLRGGWENGALGPELVSSSLSLSVGVCVCMFVCVWFKVSSLTPVTSAPSGLFFPLLPSLSVAHSLAALTRLLTFRASWEMTPQQPAAVKTLRAHC